jgi:hypothetical protein
VLPIAAAGRFELNYVWPLASRPHDRLARGLHMGFAAGSFV